MSLHKSDPNYRRLCKLSLLLIKLCALHEEKLPTGTQTNNSRSDEAAEQEQGKERKQRKGKERKVEREQQPLINNQVYVLDLVGLNIDHCGA